MACRVCGVKAWDPLERRVMLGEDSPDRSVMLDFRPSKEWVMMSWKVVAA